MLYSIGVITRNNLLLLWDLDGTLLKSKGASSHSGFLASLGLDKALPPKSLNGMTDFEILDFMLNQNPDLQANPSFIMKAFDDYCENYVTWEIERLISDTDLISIGHDVSHGILTGNTLRRATGKLTNAGINFFEDSRFMFTCLSGDSRESIVRRANNELKLQGYRCFIVGDTPRDVFAAKTCGFPTISISSGNYSFEELREINPKRTLAKFEVNEFRKLILR